MLGSRGAQNSLSSTDGTPAPSVAAKKSSWGGFSSTINKWGAGTFLFDMLKEAISFFIPPVKTFLTEAVHPLVNATTYIAPSIVMFVPHMVKKCRQRCIEAPDLDPDENLSRREQIEKVIAKDVKLKKLFEDAQRSPTPENEEKGRLVVRAIEATLEQQSEENLEGFNTSMNAYYLMARPFRGGMIVALMYDLASQETNEEVGGYTDQIYNVLGAIYLLAMFIRGGISCCRRRQPSHLFNSSTLFTPKNLQEVDVVVADFKQPLLTESERTAIEMQERQSLNSP